MMLALRPLGGSVKLGQLSSLVVFAQGRTVAITVDDLPYAWGTLRPQDVSAEAPTAVIINRKLLGAFNAHHVPVTSLVIEKQVEPLGAVGGLIPREWINQGLDEQIEEEIMRDESGIEPLTRPAEKRLEFFRSDVSEVKKEIPDNVPCLSQSWQGLTVLPVRLR
jgi:hypothetical protein